MLPPKVKAWLGQILEIWVSQEVKPRHSPTMACTFNPQKKKKKVFLVNEATVLLKRLKIKMALGGLRPTSWVCCKLDGDVPAFTDAVPAAAQHGKSAWLEG